MRQSKINRLPIILMLLLLVSVFVLSFALPITAQDGGFTTNTPEGDPAQDNAVSDDSGASPMIFATNTPEAMSANAFEAPSELLFNYGLRFWLEPDFVDLVTQQIQVLETDSFDAPLAVNLLLYEMEQRFPSAPADLVQREQMIAGMMTAPMGTLDMRGIVRPFIQTVIDDDPSASFIERNGFTISLTPANLDGVGELDRVVNIVYEDEAGLKYDEHLLATANDSGSFTLLDTNYDLPAVPFGGVQAVSVAFLRDVNSDTLDELVLRVEDGVASDRLYILEHRNGTAVDLVDPSMQLRVGEIVNWAVDVPTSTAPELTVLEYQAVTEYPNWHCLNQIEYTWVYERNLYRRTQDLNARLSNVDSLGCTLLNTDLFTLSTDEAITLIESSLLEYGFEDPSANRALMTLSMFYVLSGRLDDARNTAQSVITAGDDTTWESRQASALLRATNASGNTALDICEAVAIASEFPACDMNAVIGVYLDFVDLTTDEDLEQQLADIGLPVLESITVNEIGLAERIVVNFEYFDSGWYAFADNRDGTYRYESVEPPIEFAELIFPMALIDAPQSAIDALLVDNQPARVLSILDNTVRENPDTPLSPGAIYMQALASEFTGDRDTARELYYTIWELYPDRIWGEIASTHLELR